MQEPGVGSVKYKSLEDLVKFVSLTPHPFLNHLEYGGRHIYFFQIPFVGSLAVYWAEDQRRVGGSYMVFKRMTGKISFSDKPTYDAQSADIPVLEVEGTDLLPVFEEKG